MSVGRTGYAVFDIETTGFSLYPDSIVEIAVVHVDALGAITGSWDTLLRPQDDVVGPTFVHGITQDMVLDAPRFAEVAPQLHGLFAGRVPVAHRLPQFDGRFVAAHFAWSGIRLPQLTRGLCTWKHARRHLPLASHTLGACCGHLGIDLTEAHQALADTLATAKLLSHFITAGFPLEGVALPALTGMPHPRSPAEDRFLPRTVATRPHIGS
ncbi:3'-5' exonuclease [Actinocrinis puniceicyclus]|uniref:3'-5' exonuclease n=1 Tax=Actinocrinis puniceicyclus TaxID=977794 RepID=A0A8J7WW20_9ACTN|nr:3'-5' exonuclease [Actinocrinis puniceicyclus]MBS2966945.1 3'-5' exonuclease [Actinocrinis puniceicyclus]